MFLKKFRSLKGGTVDICSGSTSSPRQWDHPQILTDHKLVALLSTKTRRTSLERSKPPQKPKFAGLLR